MRPLARIANAAVVAGVLWLASTAICIAGVVLGRWLDSHAQEA